MNSSFSKIAAVLILMAFISPTVALSQSLFFTKNSQELWRANLDGSGQTSMFTYPNFPLIGGLAYDGANSFIFIIATQQGPGFNVQSIDRINHNGTGFTQLINVGAQFPLSITYNPTDNKIYWLEQGTSGLIRRANTDGSTVETVLSDADAAFRQIRIHISNQQIFWTDGLDPTASNFGSLRRAPVGTGVSQTTIWPNVGSNTLEGFDFSFATNEVFWVQDTNLIQRAALDGTGVVTTVLSGASVGSNMEDIVVDRTANKIYWSDLASDVIKSANLDGSALMTIIDGGAGGFSVGPGLAVENADLPVTLQRYEID